jgi:hypothetical protein
MMATLRIEHSISDFSTWKEAFDRFASARTQARVRRYRIFRPVDDPAYVLLDLDFDEVSAAEAFLAFLQREVWGSAQASPALVGNPQARILETAESHDA